jgi:hypothetical protein
MALTLEEQQYQKELETICTARTEQIRLTLVMNQRLIAAVQQAKELLETALKQADSPLQ